MIVNEGQERLHTVSAEVEPISWLVIGRGRAGQIRARDIVAEPGHRLLHHVAGRASAATLAAALADAEVSAVAICVENARHGDLVAACLHAGHHVLVEFPLCHAAEHARDLLADARVAGLVLHVELIGMLHAGHLAFKARSRQAGLTELHVEFSAGLYRWVADEVVAQRWGQLALARLHALWDLVGPLKLSSVALRLDDGYVLDVGLRDAGGESITLRERRGPDIARGVTWTARDATGAALTRDRPQPGGVPLFLQDLRVFAARVRGDSAAAYVSDETIIAVAALAESISLQAMGRCN